MFHHHYRIAQLLELAEYVDQAVRIPAVKPDTGFVEDVETAHQTASQRSGQVDALAFAARERITEPVQGEIPQSHIDQETDAAVDLCQDAACHGLVVFVQFKRIEELLQFGDGQVHQFRDVFATYAHVSRFGFQAGTVAFRTKRLSTIACQHHTILNLVLVLFKHLEKVVDAVEILVSFPQHPALFIGQLVVRGENREVEFFCIVNQFFAPFTHLLAPPADDGSVVDRQRTVGHYQMFVDADHLAESFAYRTGTDR